MNSTESRNYKFQYLLAFLFLLSPFANILFSFAGSGVVYWHDINVLVPFVKSIPVFDWLWLGLLFISGILLFIKHNWSLVFAGFILILTFVINILRFVANEENSIDLFYLKLFFMVGSLVTIMGLILLAYFRFPGLGIIFFKKKG